VVAHTHVGLGLVDALGRHSEGASVDETVNQKASTETSKRLELDLDVGFGEIRVEAQHAAA
jgi:hypothetical protein